MSRSQGTRRRWLPSFRQFVVSLLDLIANTSGMYLIPPPHLSGPAAPDAVSPRHCAAAPDAEPARPDVAIAPLTDGECRAWERLVRELGGDPESGWQ